MRMSALFLVAATVTVITPAIAQQQQKPSRKWPESKIFEVVNRVRAGRDLTPKWWPHGARVAVGLSFDFDNETPSLRDGQASPSLIVTGLRLSA